MANIFSRHAATRLAAVSLGLSLIPHVGAADDWKFEAGGGLVSAPRALGSGRQITIPIPFVAARYRGWFFASDNPAEGIGVTTKLGSGWSASAALGLDMDARDPGQDDRVRALRKISAAGALTGRVEYEAPRYFVSVSLAERLASGDSRGATLATEAGYNLFANDRVLASAGVDVRLMDNRWATNLLTVTSADAQRSGLGAFQARAGLLDVGGFAQALYRIDDRWTLFSRLQYARLEGDAGISPVVSHRNSFVGLFFVTRAF